MLLNLFFEFALWTTLVLVTLHHHIMDVFVSVQEYSQSQLYTNKSKQI